MLTLLGIFGLLPALRLMYAIRNIRSAGAFIRPMRSCHEDPATDGSASLYALVPGLWQLIIIILWEFVDLKSLEDH